MTSQLRKAVLLVIAVLCVQSSGAQQAKRAYIHGQRAFSENEPIKHPVAVPPRVIRLLMKTKEAAIARSYGRDFPDDPSELFQAAEIHLARPDQVDLVVIGEDPMSGADNTWFWLVRSAYTKPRIILFAGGNGIKVKETRANGYLDIHCFWSSPSATSDELYRFDGTKYRLVREKWTPNQ